MTQVGGQDGGAPGGPSLPERTVALAAVLAGLAVAVALAPHAYGLNMIAWNALYAWGPQALVLAVLLAWRPRPAVLAGAALAMALHYVAFHAWIHAQGPREALAWLYYLFAFPGALLGAAAATRAVRRRDLSPALAGAAAAALTAVGIALNHGATVLTGGFGL